jgi:ABC-2 type transport system permease protein
MRTLLRKELREQWRSHRLLVVAAVLTAVGILGPLTARYMSELLGSIPGTPEGLEAVLPPPTADLAIGELTENLAQFGLILALLVPMAAVVGEKASGTAALTLSKPVSRAAFLAAKLLALLVTFTLGVSLAVGAGYAYTGMLFEWLPIGGFALLGATVLLYLFAYASLALLASTLMRSQLAAAGLAFGLALALGLVGTIPAVGAYLPSALLGWGRTAASGTLPELPWRSLLATAAGIPGLLALAWAALRRQEL